MAVLCTKQVQFYTKIRTSRCSLYKICVACLMPVVEFVILVLFVSKPSVPPYQGAIYAR